MGIMSVDSSPQPKYQPATDNKTVEQRDFQESRSKNTKKEESVQRSEQQVAEARSRVHIVA